jgi:hypothetical protein
MVARMQFPLEFKPAAVKRIDENSIRRIVMSPVLRQALEQHRLIGRASEMDLVFSNENGLSLDPENLIKREFLPALDRAGLRRIRFHDLRHTYASLLISQGENIKFIQSQLGHASAKTTLDRYRHLMPNLENDAARRLDKTVFGNFVRKLLENPVSEGNSAKIRTPEVVELQGLKLNLVSGGTQRSKRTVVPQEVTIAGGEPSSEMRIISCWGYLAHLKAHKDESLGRVLTIRLDLFKITRLRCN